ncbi:ATP-binding cassette domain-containing protein [Flavobacteriales bacterium]|nr:ATP-binding cassette domain-containing protein [Flavobacteriales bacterium]
MPAYIKCNDLSKVFSFDGDSQLQTDEGPKRHFSGNSLVALENISFELKEGDVLGVIGLNGAGKSTLLKILSGILKPTSGEAEISGSVTSILEQSSIFSSELTGIENLLFYGNILGYKSSYIQSKTSEILKFADLEVFGEVKLKNYSSGMKLRLAFGLMKELSSDILILDEALSAGDQIFQEKITATLDTYFDENRIVIMATHDFREITRYCNKCLLLEYGRPAFFGSSEEAVSIFYAQNRGKKEESKKHTRIHLISSKCFPEQKTFSVNESFDFVFEYEVLEDNLPLDTLLTVTNNHGPVLIDSPMFRANHETEITQKGLYKKKVAFPSPLLNTGRFRISLLFGDGEDTTYLKEDNVVTIEIGSDGSAVNNKIANAASSFPVRHPLHWGK